MRWALAAVLAVGIPTTAVAQEKTEPPVRNSLLKFVPDPSYRAMRGEKAVACGYDKKRDVLYEPDGAVYRFAYEELWKCLDIKDDAGIDELKERGHLVDVPIGTELLVIETERFPEGDPRATCATVRVMDGPLAGKKLWMALFHVAKMVPNPKYAGADAAGKESTGNPSPKLTDSPVAMLNRGMKFYDDNQYSDAVEALRFLSSVTAGTPLGDVAEAIVKDSKDKMAGTRIFDASARMLSMARNLEKAKLPDPALGYYRKVVKWWPKSTETKIAAARIRSLAGK